MGQVLEYCSRCGTSGPPEYFKERDGLTLCPECYNEPPIYDEFDRVCGYIDLFDEMKNLDPYG